MAGKDRDPADFRPHLPDVRSLPDPKGQGLGKQTVTVTLLVMGQQKGLEGPPGDPACASRASLTETQVTPGPWRRPEAVSAGPAVSLLYREELHQN